jgi:glucokinase
LDAGGTNFVFNGMQGNKELLEPVRLPSEAHDLKKSLNNIVEGFSIVRDKLPEKPVAISFAFPGPADYPRGIIGDLPNLKGYRGGVALGPMLSEKFNLPVFINNDGDLFAYGEAIAGFLPSINEKLEKSKSVKRYQNLFGITLGTGFGAGMVNGGEMYIGDNAAACEIWLLRNKKYPATFVEESVSIRSIQQVYKNQSGTVEDLSPKEIYDIAKGNVQGDKNAAKKAFTELGEIAGDALANAITLFDGLIVVGGGLTGAKEFILPAIVNELNSSINTKTGEKIPRLSFKVYNLEDENEVETFLKGQQTNIQVPGSGKKISYDPEKRIGIGFSQLGASKAISIGAYAFALNQLNK